MVRARLVRSQPDDLRARGEVAEAPAGAVHEGRERLDEPPEYRDRAQHDEDEASDERLRHRAGSVFLDVDDHEVELHFADALPPAAGVFGEGVVQRPRRGAEDVDRGGRFRRLPDVDDEANEPGGDDRAESDDTIDEKRAEAIAELRLGIAIDTSRALLHQPLGSSGSLGT